MSKKNKKNTTAVIPTHTITFAQTAEVIKNETTSVDAWFFSTDNKRLKYGDNRPVVVGETHNFDLLTPNMCEAGLHASPIITDAMLYAPGKHLYRVELGGVVKSPYSFLIVNKYVGSSRKYIAEAKDFIPILDKHVRDMLLMFYKRQTDTPLRDDFRKFLETGSGISVDDLTANNLSDRYERLQIDAIWNLLQCQNTTNGYAQIKLYRDFLNNLYYAPGMFHEDIFNSLDNKVLEAMGLPKNFEGDKPRVISTP